MSEYIFYESKSDKVTDYLGVKHYVSHYEKREEIVRCKDCVHFERTARNGICHRSEFLPMWAEPGGFCAWGKRKEGGE